MSDRRESSDGRRSDDAADRVAAILSAAEDAAERLRNDAETRVRDRVAEGARAAQNRIDAAEEEAAETLAGAAAEAERLLRDGRERDDRARRESTAEAEAKLADATERAARARDDAERHSREMLAEARQAAGAVRTEGTELVENLRQLSDSLRANAERLLRDVAEVHHQMIARIDAVEAAYRAGPDTPRRRRADRPRERLEPAVVDAEDVIDVPEFIPRR